MRKYGHLFLLIVGVGLLLLMTQSVQWAIPSDLSNNLVLLPELIPPPGIYHKSLSIRMQPSHPQGKIIFTTDGSVPSAISGTLYTHPILLDNAFANVTTIRAVEVAGEETSPLVTASYAVGLSDDLPIVVLTTEPTQLWDAQIGLLVNPDRRGPAWERTIEFAMLQRNAPQETSQTAGIRIIGDPLPRQDKHNFRLYFRTEYGNPRLDFNPFQDDSSQFSNKNTYKRLLLQAAREGSAITIIRDQLVADILAAAGLPAAQGRIVHLVINGDSWGLYRLTERIDNIFLEDTLNISIADIVQEGNAREGSDEAWNLLLSWVTNHNMVDDSNLRTLESDVNLDNLIAMACVQTYFQLPADAYYAIHPENGRWFWIYEGGGTQPLRNSDFSLLFNQLLRNDTFRLKYASRCGDMLNSELSSAVISQRFQDLSRTLLPYFPLEQARWPNTAPWDIVFTRQAEILAYRESQVRGDIDRVLGNTGIADLHFQSVPSPSGEVYVNGTKMTSSGLQGLSKSAYFIGTDLYLQAVSTPGSTFLYWQLEKDGVLATLSAEKSLTLTVTSEYTISARFEAQSQPKQDPAPDDVHFNEYWISDNGTRYASIGYRAIEGDWVELLVEKPGVVDLRQWRITDNDSKSGTDEGSIILPYIDTLESVPRGTIILFVTTQSPSNDENFPVDDLSVQDKLLLFYVGNGNLDMTTDPGFNIDAMNDNLALLSPGLQSDFSDDTVVDFIAEGLTVTAYSFGALDDDVSFDRAFSRLGNDDGAILSLRGSNDNLSDWIVDPDSCHSGDTLCTNTRNIVTPGRFNPSQSWLWILERDILPKYPMSSNQVRSQNDD